MIRAALLSAALSCAAALAAADAGLTRLYDLLELPAYLEITRTEGLADATELATDMLGRSPGAGFHTQMTRLYDGDRLQQTVMEPLAAMDPAHVEAALAFFQSDPARKIAELEVAARQAMSAEDVEAAAQAAWGRADSERPELAGRIRELIAINDLVERNVSGALNSNLRFYQGMAEGGALEMTEEEMLSEVWAQEPQIRADTESWLGGYLLLAYDPLGSETLEAYATFWRTEAGRALNAALFEGFNHVYDDVAYATGRLLALETSVQDL